LDSSGSRYGLVKSYREYGNEPLGSIKEQLRNCRLLKRPLLHEVFKLAVTKNQKLGPVAIWENQIT
jgi:hypothetical protein